MRKLLRLSSIEHGVNAGNHVVIVTLLKQRSSLKKPRDVQAPVTAPALDFA
jgi:hypothetical protein